jgi:8-oxo-dGTP pyrophosphatase MutT (NUDIX family)
LHITLNPNKSGVIPFRKIKDGIEVLLITSVKKKRWIIPKGYIEFNLTPFESAKKEAYEEAGVIGSNETIELGDYKAKGSPSEHAIKVFSLEVMEVLQNYPEINVRKRKWFQLKEAAEKVSIPEVATMILSLEKKIK